MPSVKGTASVADERARNKALKKTKFASCFQKSVNVQKVHRAILTQWIEQKITSILGFEDEIVSSTAINLFLPGEGEDAPDPKRAQLDLVGFLGENESAAFAKELWKLMLEAQENSTGIPKTILEQKKRELAAQKFSATGQQKRQQPPNHENGNPRHMGDHNMEEAKSRARRVMEEHRLQNDGIDRQVADSNSTKERSQSGRRWGERPQPNGNAGPSPNLALPTRHEDDRKLSPPQDSQGPELDQYGRVRRSNDVDQENPKMNRGARDLPLPARGHGRERPVDSNHNRVNYDRDYHYYEPHHRYNGRVEGSHDHDVWREDHRGQPQPPTWYDDRRRSDRRGPPPGYDDRPRFDHRDRLLDYEREIEELDRRLVLLRKQHSRRIDDPNLIADMEGIEDRLYELERNRARFFRLRNDYRGDRGICHSPEHRRHRPDSRSASYNRQRLGNNSPESDGRYSSRSSRSRSRSVSESDDDDDSRRSRSRNRSRSRSHSSRSHSPPC